MDSSKSTGDSFADVVKRLVIKALWPQVEQPLYQQLYSWLWSTQKGLPFEALFIRRTYEFNVIIRERCCAGIISYEHQQDLIHICGVNALEDCKQPAAFRLHDKYCDVLRAERGWNIHPQWAGFCTVHAWSWLEKHLDSFNNKQSGIR
jgi:hypothetical protein